LVSTVSRAGSTSLVTAVGLACLIVFASSSFAQDDPGKAAFEKGGCEMCHGAGAGGAMGPALVPLGDNEVRAEARSLGATAPFFPMPCG
jgi:cytochrome c2